MIRDFFTVKGRTLFDEINSIKEHVDPLTWDAIDAVRSIGNIGAHMEKDINVIIDVDQSEALLLIGLIESLIQDWYIARFERQQRLKSIVGVADQFKIGSPSTPQLEPFHLHRYNSADIAYSLQLEFGQTTTDVKIATLASLVFFSTKCLLRE